MPSLPKHNHSCSRADHSNTRSAPGGPSVAPAPYVIGAGAGGGPAANHPAEGQLNLHGCSPRAENLAARITRLLADCDRLRRGSEIDTSFTPANQTKAELIAAADQNDQ